jgi:hypothetical protein
MITWIEADEEVLEIARQLIRDHRPDLRDASICFVYRSEPGSSKGRKVLGQASTISKKMRVVLDFEFMIWISKPDFRDMDDLHRKALIDHELCHCAYSDDNDAPMMRGHDIEEFGFILRTYGLWNDGLAYLGGAMNDAIQMKLPDVELKSRGKVVTISSEQIKQMIHNTQEALAEDPGLPEKITAQLLEEVKQLKNEEGEISISKIQRKLQVGYTKAKELYDFIQAVGIGN